MDMTIKELKGVADAINEIANRLEKQFNNGSNETLQKNPILTLEQVRAVLADKSRAGLTDEVRALLKKYGADRLSKVDPSHYEDLVKDAEVL